MNMQRSSKRKRIISDDSEDSDAGNAASRYTPSPANTGIAKHFYKNTGTEGKIGTATVVITSPSSNGILREMVDISVIEDAWGQERVNDDLSKLFARNVGHCGWHALRQLSDATSEKQISYSDMKLQILNALYERIITSPNKVAVKTQDIDKARANIESGLTVDKNELHRTILAAGYGINRQGFLTVSDRNNDTDVAAKARSSGLPRPKPPSKHELKMLASSWRGDDEPDSHDLTSKTPNHKIDEHFTKAHNIRPAVRLTWALDQKHTRSEIFTLAAVETFGKLRNTIANIPAIAHNQLTSNANPNLDPRVHIDRFTIHVTSSLGERRNSAIDPETKRFRETQTEDSPETFNALMRAAAARISVAHDLCACGEKSKCEDAKKMPDVKVWLSSLDRKSLRRIRSTNGSRKGQKQRKAESEVCLDKTVILDQERRWSPLQHMDTFDKITNISKVIIKASCLERIHQQSQRTQTSPRRRRITVSKISQIDDSDEDLDLEAATTKATHHPKNKKVVDIESSNEARDQSDEFYEPIKGAWQRR